MGVSMEERFWIKVEKTDGCWLWRASLHGDGYGLFKVDGATQRAHRVVYEMEVGPIPDGYTIDHLCRVRACVRPSHLEAVTHRENVQRAAAAITHCKNGHAFTPENTYWRKEGGRNCKRCVIDRVNRTRQRRYARGLTATGKPKET